MNVIHDDRRFEEGTMIVYEDGRPGHTEAVATVLGVDRFGMTVEFEDRADTTHIRFDDRAWMDFMTQR